MKNTPNPTIILVAVSLPENLTHGKLYLCSTPRRFDPLEAIHQAISAAKIGHVLCMVSDGEIARKSPGDLEAIRQDRLPAKLWRHDVPDYGIPEDSEGLNQMLDHVRGRLDASESLAIHRAAGHGRTGI